RQVATVCRKVARELLKKEASKTGKKKSTEKAKGYVVTPKTLIQLIGPAKLMWGKIETDNEIGMTNGMAWTETGGDLLPIEVAVVPGRGKFTVTGQLGDVMKESCSAAMSYVRSRGPLFGFEKEFFSNHDVHIHAPEGAIPKD